MSAGAYDEYKNWTVENGNKTECPDDLSAFGTQTFAADENDLTKIHVTGTAEYVTKFEKFGNGNPENCEGNYLLYQFEVPEDVTDISAAKVTVDGAEYDKNAFDTVNGKSVFAMIRHLGKGTRNTDSIVIKVDWDGAGSDFEELTYTLDLTGMTLEQKATAGTEQPAKSEITITTMTDGVYSAYKKSIPQGNNTTAPDGVSAFGTVTFTPKENTSTTIKAAGTLNYIANFGMFGNGNPANSSGNYLLWQVAVPEGIDTSKASLTVAKGGTTVEFGENNNPFDTIDGESYMSMIYRIASNAETITIKIDWDGNGTAYDETTYTLDLSGVTLAAKTNTNEGE